jgi:hypothetical protein
MRTFVIAVVIAALLAMWVLVAVGVLAAAVRQPRRDRRPVDG